MGIALLLVVTGVVTAAGVVVVRDGLRWAAELLSVVSVALAAVTFAAAADEDAVGLSRLDGRQASWITAVLVVVGALGWSRLAFAAEPAADRRPGLRHRRCLAAGDARLRRALDPHRVRRLRHRRRPPVRRLVAARKGVWIFAVWTAALAASTC